MPTATSNVPNDQVLFTDSGAGTLYAGDSFSNTISGRWAYGTGVSANAHGDFPESGFGEFQNPPADTIYTFGLLTLVWPIGLALPTCPPDLLNTITRGLLLPGPSTGGDDFASAYAYADIVASNPIGTGPWGVYYRIGDNQLFDNIPQQFLTVDTSICNIPRTLITVTATQKCTVQPLDQSILVSWTSDPLATGYYLVKDGVLIETLDASVLSFADGANVGDTHTYTVQPFNDCGAGLISQSVSATVTGWVRDCGGGVSTMTKSTTGVSTMTRKCGGCQ